MDPLDTTFTVERLGWGLKIHNHSVLSVLSRHNYNILFKMNLIKTMPNVLRDLTNVFFVTSNLKSLVK